LVLFGQTNSFTHPVKNFGVSLHYASIFAHSEDVQNTQGANPVGIEFLFTKQKRTEKDWQICNCYLNQGFGANYFNFDNGILGHSVNLFYNFEPQFKLSKKLNFVLSVNGGLSFLSNPYNKNSNPANQSYSLPISAYVGLGPGFQLRLNDKLQLGLLGHYLHVSNGGIKDPNKGVNWPSLNLRLIYSPNLNTLPDFQKSESNVIKKNRLDVGFFASSKTIEAGEKDRFLIYGLQVNFSKQASNLNALTIGNEVIIDHVTRERLVRSNLNNSFVRNGILVGHEFLLGNFIFSQQLGYYLFNDTRFFNQIYHRWGLNYRTKNNLMLGINLLAHAQVANFLDFRITWRLFEKNSNQLSVKQ
jgi:hypothetical protein